LALVTAIANEAPSQEFQNAKGRPAGGLPTKRDIPPRQMLPTFMIGVRQNRYN
jgi:hypothetical protein